MARSWFCLPGFSFKKSKNRRCVKQPQYVDQYHTFRNKTVRKPVPCDVCKQPIYSQGSCCRVCKYICHRTCEPRVHSSCDTPLFDPMSHESLNQIYSSPTNKTVQLRKSQSFPAGRAPIDECYLHDYRSRLRLRPQTIEMDLNFITERIISMSFPMTGMDDSYRNSLQEVIKMLRSKHGENYMIFNLSDQRNDMSQLNHQLLEFGWPDPLAPPLERLCSICKAMDGWLSSDSQHVVVLHCKGGKEQTAIVVAAYMHYCNICAISADQALDRFAMKKFFHDKSGGLVTPSHKRLVNYFAGLLSGAIEISSSPLYLHQIVLFGAPNFDSQGGCHLFVKVYQGLKPIYTSGVYTVTGSVRLVTISLDTPIQLRGDCLIKAYHRRTKPDGRDLIFRCQFHTCAISEYLLIFNKEDLDDACDDNRFPEDGRLEFKFSSVPDRRFGGARDVSVPVDYSSDAIVHANSYENLKLIAEENPYDTAYINPRFTVHHTIGPLDGNPYATVSKKKPQTNGYHNGGPTASMDSGISSATPPHSGQSSSSAGTGVGSGHVNGTPTPTTNGHSVFKTQAEIHSVQIGKPLDSEEQRKLDELLDGMMAQVETIPDLKPGTHIVKRVTYSPDTFIHTNGNGYTTVNEDEVEDKELPYHARKHSQPFSYLVPGSSPTVSRKYRCVNPSVLAIERRAKMNEENCDLPLPPPQPSLNFVGGRNESSPRQVFISLQPTPVKNEHITKPQSYSHDSAYDSDPNSYKGLDVDKDSDKWLQRQQEKLRARQEAKVRQERYPKEKLLFIELRTAQAKLPKPVESSDDDDLLDLHIVDGHLDHQKPLYVNTYINGYDKQQNDTGTPVRGKTFSGPHSLPSSGKPPPGRGGSAPSSPLIPNRTSSRDATRQASSRYGTWQTSGSSPQKPVARQQSDTSFDRERPFVSVKKAYEFSQANLQKNVQRGAANPEFFAAISNSPVYQNVTLFNYIGDRLSPTSPTKSSGGLLTTVPKTGLDQPRTSSPISGHLEDLDFSIQTIGQNNWSSNASSHPEHSGSPSSSFGLDNRPATPGFPVPSRTPYSDQDSGASPKRPTSSRKDRSPSPATVQQLRSGLALTADGHPHTDGGQSSPTVYYGQSRRSSLISLTEPIEVIHHLPMFVKDTSKFWYKPNISREDAINVLKDKPPGNFLVRDSNSFPGAFGLALKVASPPTNVQNKSGDISTELVRHFLIEPTAKGVKLKGCSNEPVFGSLSALVYQHSITQLALPCKLILPETDLQREDILDNDSYLAAQLLAQGAACNVLYLFTLDVESLTGPQAVRKTSQLLTEKQLPESTVVHFKVSSQGITITDNKRQLFFRRHYPVLGITHCGLDPDDRRWARPVEDPGLPVMSKRVTFCDRRIFGVVARKPTSKTDNQCHLFAELEPEQPATAIVNFVTKVLMSSSTVRATII